MKLVEINLKGSNLDELKRLCVSLSERYEGCTLYQNIGYYNEGNKLKRSYKGTKGYGIKVLTEEQDLNRMEKIIRTDLLGMSINWIQVVSYEVDTTHLELKG